MRVAVEVDKDLLKQSIKEVEKNGAMSNRFTLHEAVCVKYNKGSPPRPITPAIVGSRIKDWNLTVVTPLGKRGRQSGNVMSEEQKAAMLAGRANTRRVPKSEKFALNPEVMAGFKIMRRNTSERFHNKVDKAQAGSLRAAASLMCIQCCCDQLKEIKFCACNDCPLFAFRPYQPKRGETIDNSVEVEDEVEEEIEV